MTVDPFGNDDTGENGKPGPKGDKGEKGDAGGPPGAKGDKGDTGLQGPTGSQGPQGHQGDTGLHGHTGTKGDKGDTGLQGPTGSQGPQGHQGDQGHTGIKGDTGHKGLQGPKGNQGSQGNVGPQGIQGSKGDVGPQGPKGTGGVPQVAEDGSISVNKKGELLVKIDKITPNLFSSVSGLTINCAIDGGLSGVNGSDIQHSGLAIELDNNSPFNSYYNDEARSGYRAGFVLTDKGIRLASYGGWRLPIISRASDRLMDGVWHLFPVYPYIGLSLRDQVIYQVPTKIFIRSILVSTMVANSETAGMADFAVYEGDTVNSGKELFQFKKNYDQKNLRTIQAMVNMVIEAGTSIFFKWYFNPVHLAKYGPTVVKFEVLGSYLSTSWYQCQWY